MIKEWFKKIWEGGKYEEELAEWLRGGITKEELAKWRNGMPKGYGYSTFKIPKRRKGGFREIEAPNEALKKLQKEVYWGLMWRWDKEKSHPSCTGFVPGKSIVDAAKPHVAQAVVIKDLFQHGTVLKWKMEFLKQR